MNIVVINKNQEDKINLIEDKIHEFNHVFCFISKCYFKNINEMSKTLKPSMGFTLRTHLSSDKPHFSCSVTTWQVATMLDSAALDTS